MPLPYVQRIIDERDEAIAAVRAARDELREIIFYLTSSKFQGPDNDYVHVRTDILPKLGKIHFGLCGQ